MEASACFGQRAGTSERMPDWRGSYFAGPPTWPTAWPLYMPQSQPSLRRRSERPIGAEAWGSCLPLMKRRVYRLMRPDSGTRCRTINGARSARADIADRFGAGQYGVLGLLREELPEWSRSEDEVLLVIWDHFSAETKYRSELVYRSRNGMAAPWTRRRLVSQPSQLQSTALLGWARVDGRLPHANLLR